MKSPRITPLQLLDWIEEFIYQNGISPTVREMAEALDYSSPSPIQNMLSVLREQGDIDWTDRKSRSIRVLRPRHLKIAVRGTIAAHSLLETFPDLQTEWLDAPNWLQSRWSPHEIAQMFGLWVRGDSMNGALIADGDLVIMKTPSSLEDVKNGDIVSARVNSQTTLKYFYLSQGSVTLQPANPAYPATRLDPSEVHIQGIYVGLIRGLS